MSSADYGRARWYGAHPNNYSEANRPNSPEIDKIVVHTVQGSWSSAINWFNDSRAGVSAHYTVRSDDGFIGQSVHERDIAYHAGNWPYNQTSIGIEHEGFISDSSWYTDEMYLGSARLSAYLVKKYNIPLDREHIVGHHEVPGCSGDGGGAGCHVDPGNHWDWDRYMRLIRSFDEYRQVVDNANGNRFRASDAWRLSSYNSQKLGKDYAYASPGTVNDPAMFKIRVPRRGRYALFARWPADPGYNPEVEISIRTANGWVIRERNQQNNGGRWVGLGRFTMPAGDGWWVRIRRKSSASGYVIADGVLIREV